MALSSFQREPNTFVKLFSASSSKYLYVLIGKTSSFDLPREAARAVYQYGFKSTYSVSRSTIFTSASVYIEVIC
jgi:hypothetical protein